MAEWLKAHAWKACLGETLTWVRIPLSPPEHSGQTTTRFPERTGRRVAVVRVLDSQRIWGYRSIFTADGRFIASCLDVSMEKNNMTSLTIELPDEQKAALVTKAQARGLSAEQYARKVLEYDLVPGWLQKSWETSQEAGLGQLSMDEIDAEISAARSARRETRPHPGS